MTDTEKDPENSGETPATHGYDARPQEHGGVLKTGNFGNRGGGRTSTAWSLRMREMVFDPEVVAQLQAVLRDRNHPAWSNAVKLATAYAVGQPSNRVHITRDDDVMLLDLMNRLSAEAIEAVASASDEEMARLVPAIYSGDADAELRALLARRTEQRRAEEERARVEAERADEAARPPQRAAYRLSPFDVRDLPDPPGGFGRR